MNQFKFSFSYKTKAQLFFIGMLTVLTFSSCNYEQVTESSSASSGIPTAVLTILESKCIDCHSGSNASAGFGFVTNEAQMISANYITPGNYAQSTLYKKLTSSPPFGDRMPKGGPYLTSDELTTIANWIDSIGVTPTVSITTPTSGSNINVANNSATFAISGNCNVINSKVKIYVNSELASAEVTCDGANFSTQVDTTTTPFISGTNTLYANMSSSLINTNSASITLTKNLNTLSIAFTTPLNNSLTTRSTSDVDSSFITSSNNSSTYSVSGVCNRAGETVTLKVDGTSVSSATCNGSNFSGSINTTLLVDGNHKFEATITDSTGTASDTVNVYRWVTAPTISFTNDIAPLFAQPISGNQRACIDCHYVNSGPAAGSSSFSMGYWNSCSSGGKPTGTGGSCQNSSATSAYTQPPSLSERQAFNYKLGYHRYTNISPASNGTSYTYSLTIVNDNYDSPNQEFNRIVRGKPNQSFIYKKISGKGSASISDSNPAIITMTSGHSLNTGDTVRFTTGTLPSNMSNNTIYYVTATPTSNTYRISTTASGTDLSTLGQGTSSGTISVAQDGCGHSVSNSGGSPPYTGCKTNQANNSDRMPRYNATYIPNYLSDTDIAKIRTWIIEGARTDN